MMPPDARVVIGDSRSMSELEDRSVELVVTSPPYWQIKDYGAKGQIGHGQTLHEYLKDLYLVWRECFRVLDEGRRLCINIGDQFARASVYGRYKVIPIHAEMISQCEGLGFDFLGSIIWQKRTTMRTSGGATVMGSFPFPPNGIVEVDHEHILLFKKPGKAKKVPAKVKERSRLTKAEWKQFFSGHWTFGGAKQVGHEAMFPDELPRRLIKMFSFVGETVLDPFLGSGTTVKLALDLERDAVGYEVNEGFVGTIKGKLSTSQGAVTITRRRMASTGSANVDYIPRIMDAAPVRDPIEAGKKGPELFKVVEVVDERTVRLNDGRKISLLGIRISEKDRAKVLDYLRTKVLRRTVFLKEETDDEAYLYLKNRIFINSYLIRSGLATVDRSKDFSKKDRFLNMAKVAKNR